MAVPLKLSSLFLFLFLFPGFSDGRDNCNSSTCGQHGPLIMNPFWLRNIQPESCGTQGYDLTCNHKNQTILELSVSVKLVVSQIDYTSQTIDLYDPNSCLPKQLFNSLSPTSFIRFSPFSHLSSVAFFNCSPPNRTFGSLVPCLSAGENRVYATTDQKHVSVYELTSCVKIRKISQAPVVMFPLNDSDIYGNHTNITLTWTWITPYCLACEANGNICHIKGYNVTGLPIYECLGPITATSGASKKPLLTGLSKKLLVTGVVLGTSFLLLAMSAFYRVYTSKKLKKDDQRKIETFLEDYKVLKPTRYSFADIKKITNKFKHKLGEGGHGTVFKGNLSSEIAVAVKVLNSSVGNGEDFINEVETMGRIHHVNVIRLIGFCADRNRRALVYEFLPNESLEKFIFSKIISLGWEKSRDIALGIAKGIEYLHQGCDHRILHFDIKPHNILLDQKFNPKIADFGLAKLCSKEQSIVSMTNARGTMGYIAPEVFSRNFGNVSYKSDVYSFGMMLLEMVGGRKNVDVTVNKPCQIYFPEWVHNHLCKGEDLGIRIKKQEDEEIAKKLTIVGLWCIQWYPVDRPSMKRVVQMLEGKGEALTLPPSPFWSKIKSKCSTKPTGAFNRELAATSEIV